MKDCKNTIIQLSRNDIYYNISIDYNKHARIIECDSKDSLSSSRALMLGILLQDFSEDQMCKYKQSNIIFDNNIIDKLEPDFLKTIHCTINTNLALFSENIYLLILINILFSDNLQDHKKTEEVYGCIKKNIVSYNLSELIARLFGGAFHHEKIMLDILINIFNKKKYIFEDNIFREQIMAGIHY